MQNTVAAGLFVAAKSFRQHGSEGKQQVEPNTHIERCVRPTRRRTGVIIAIIISGVHFFFGILMTVIFGGGGLNRKKNDEFA